MIVGGGIAGLSAAWRLDKRGFRDFVLLEMLAQPGGNARWGENEVSAYPLAAHYVPIPNKEAVLVRELFEELGVLRDGVWDERCLCHSPQERLFLHGRWQEGIEPELASTARDREQFRRFRDRMRELREGAAVPDPDGCWARRRQRSSTASPCGSGCARTGSTRPICDWYVDYCCRDDYGARSSDTSAWAGIHYFAARDHEEKGPLTWPEGNGWIARRLAAKLAPYIRLGAMVHSLIPEGRKWRISAADTQYVCDQVIFAAPTFLASYLMDGMPRLPLTYSPWMTANLTLDRFPAEPGCRSLGITSSTTRRRSATWSPPTSRSNRSRSARFGRGIGRWRTNSPANVRREMLRWPFTELRDRILADLAPAHPEIEECVARIDILRLGHAMARPCPGFCHPARWRRSGASMGTAILRTRT